MSRRAQGSPAAPRGHTGGLDDAHTSGVADADRGHVLAAATRQRLLTVAGTLDPTLSAGSFLGTSELVARLANAVAERPDADRVWRLVVALTGAYPDSAAVLLVRRRLRLAAPGQTYAALLDALVEAGVTRYDLGRHAELVTARVLADVDFCATNHRHNTGIQRVVRQTMRRWTTDRPVTLAAWTRRDGGLRPLTALERMRVVAWGDPDGAGQPDPAAITADADLAELPLLIPVDCVVLLPEVAREPLCAPLEALATYSGNPVVMVGYDVIPVTSADSVPPAESERFTHYLGVVKHAAVVAGISETAAVEFAGFVEAVRVQGLPGPDVVSVVLPVDAPDSAAIAAPATRTEDGDRPLVLVVGSHEPRKNHYAVLEAARRLWAEGVDFRLRFVGAGNPTLTRPFDAEVRRLAAAGHPVDVFRRAGDAQLLEWYRRARFTVFPSLHEGYGLPVAESLALGVPVVTSAYGSTAEVAEGGGCVLVDPRDDDAVYAGMRDLLTDDALHGRLVEEARARPTRRWDDYATQLWDVAVAPLLTSPMSSPAGRSGGDA